MASVFITACEEDENNELTVDKTELLKLIIASQTLIADAQEGNTAGSYTIGSKATFQAAIDSAKTVSEKEAATQSEIDGVKSNLQTAKSTFEDAIILEVSVDKTTLLAKISEANNLISTTEEGTANGQYLIGSQATLQAVIEIAQVIYNNVDANQTEVDNSVVNLTSAITVYEGQIISPVAPEALIGHWTFDDGTGTIVKDLSDNGFDGEFKTGNAGFGAGTATWAADRYGNAGKAIQFDEGAFVEVPYNTALNPTKLTVALWVYADVIRESNRFLGLQSWIGYKFQLQSDNKPFFTAATDEGDDGTIYDKDAGSAIDTLKWYHLAVSFGGGEMAFYINGVETVTHDGLTGDLVKVTDHNLTFGVGSSKYADTPDNYENDQIIPIQWGGYFHGRLDEVRMYSAVLSATQIKSIYDLEKP